VRSLDDRTLVVELEGPTSYFLHLLELSTTFPEPRHSVEASGDGWTDPNVLVTNGPFRLMDWQRGAGLSLARNPTYHGQFTGNVQQVEYLVSRAWSSLLELYAEHQLDVLSLAGIGYLPIAELDAVRRRHAAEYIFAPDLGTWCVGFDVSRPPFSDRRVRRAFVLATDREWWADDVERGTVSPGTGGFVPPGMTHHSPDIGLPHDPEQARRLLAEAGYPDVSDFPAVTVVWPDEPRSAFQCAQLQQRWRVVLDVDIPFERPEPGAYLDMLQEQPPHIFFMGWLADYPDPDNFLRVGFLQQPTEWRNAEYIRLVEQARRIADQAARMKLYRQADRMLIDEAVILPLCYTRSHLLIKPWVKQYPLSPVKRWFWKDVVIEPHR
jgi:oligopeptide transport system substrate-binding protein